MDHQDLHPLDAECFRNVYKSVHGVNPRTYPCTYPEYVKEMAYLESVQQWEEEAKQREAEAEAEAWKRAFEPAPPVTLGAIFAESY